jgi:hypothetical protein
LEWLKDLKSVLWSYLLLTYFIFIKWILIFY